MERDAEFFRARLRYDPDAGQLFWVARRRRWGICAAGEKAGAQGTGGYTIVVVEGTAYRAHRIAWLLMTGAFPAAGTEIDHANGDRMDNRWTNLRLVTRSQNNMNLGPRSDNKSGHRGVSWRADTEKWHARITVNRRIILLGNFENLDDAVAARVAAERHHFGAHSFLERS